MLALFLNCSAQALPPAVKIARDFVNEDLGAVVRWLGESAGRKVYLGPGVAGKLTVSLRSVPPLAALHEVLKSFRPQVTYKLMGDDILVVAEPDCRLEGIDDGRRQPDDIRREFMLERAPAAKIIGFLKPRYDGVEFVPHPTMNGFYAVGSRSDLEAVANLIPELDVVPEFAPREMVQVSYGDLDEFRPLFDSIVPEVRLDVDTRQSTLILEGSPETVEQAKELLAKLDEPPDPVRLECRWVKLTREGQQALNLRWECQPWRAEQRLDGVVGPAALRVGRFQNTQTLIPFQPEPGPTRQITSRETFLGAPFPLIRFDHKKGSFQRCTEDVGLKLSTEFNGSHYQLHGEFAVLEELLGNRYPLSRTIVFDGTVEIARGESIVIDGLMTPDQAQKAVSAVPLLADLPEIGFLFRQIENDEATYVVRTQP